MTRRPPRATRADTLFPSTTRFRSPGDEAIQAQSQAALFEFLQGLERTGVIFVETFDARAHPPGVHQRIGQRSEEHTSELQSLMRISYAGFCLKKKTQSGAYNRAREHTSAQQTKHIDLLMYR